MRSAKLKRAMWHVLSAYPHNCADVGDVASFIPPSAPGRGWHTAWPEATSQRSRTAEPPCPSTCQRPAAASGSARGTGPLRRQGETIGVHLRWGHSAQIDGASRVGRPLAPGSLKGTITPCPAPCSLLETKPSRPHLATTAWMSFSWVSSLRASAAASRLCRSCTEAGQAQRTSAGKPTPCMKQGVGCVQDAHACCALACATASSLTCSLVLGGRPLCAACAWIAITPTDSAISLAGNDA